MGKAVREATRRIDPGHKTGFHVKDLLTIVLVLAGVAMLFKAFSSRGESVEARPGALAASDFSSADSLPSSASSTLAASTTSTSTSSTSSLGDMLDQPLDLETLLTAESVRFPLQPQANPLTEEELGGAKARILALFILNAKVCPPCLEEVSEFAELLEMENMTGEAPIRSVALVIDAAAERGERFVLTTPLPLAVGHGPPASLGALRDHLGERKRFQQLVFLDLERSVLFYRTWLPNTLTPRGLKKSVLGEMRAAHRQVAG